MRFIVLMCAKEATVDAPAVFLSFGPFGSNHEAREFAEKHSSGQQFPTQILVLNDPEWKV